ncbi:MAG: MFS transporter [Gemmatimonadaceae bacterium]|nr:MFS transporter [Gemmatimonadaceae bacterium]
MTEPGRPPLARNVRVLATVSFFTDVASEMIYPLLPLFLSTVLGTSAAALGVIEGLAESVSSLLRLPAGWYSDRIRKRKPLVLFGYLVAAVSRPLIGLAQGTGQVLAIRLTDRFGKGVRTAPRDALIADSVLQSQRGYAYGVHRAADSLGAVAGPLIAWALLTFEWVELRELFLWAAVPGLISVLLVAFLVKESRAAVPVRVVASPVSLPLGRTFWRYLFVLFVFTLSTSTDAFLLLRASQLGVATAMIPILWAMLHVVKSSSTVVGGALSDRLGRRPLILGGWAVYAAVYLGFALSSAEWHAWALFVVYGLYFGATEGTEKALVADLVPAARRGTAFGWFNAALGLGALPASVVFGLVWERSGPEVAFVMGAGIAAVATLLFVLMVPRTGREGA